MKIIKNIIAIIAMSFLIITLFSTQASAEKKIGILTFSKESRYVEAAKGFKDSLREAGIKEPKVKFFIEDAGASKALALELVQKLAAEKVDLIFTLGTSATVMATPEIKDIPIVFSIVYNPIEAGIAKDWKSSGNNTTGTSTIIDMSYILNSLTTFAPVKRIAVLYTPGEKNSESQLKDLQKIQVNYKIEIIPVILINKEDIPQMLPNVLRTTDALYITGSNMINSQVSLIVDMATKSKVITITHLEDLVEKGVLLGVCADSYLLGRLAGGKAVKILKGAKPASIPIGVTKKFNIILNMKTAKAGHFQITSQYKKTITKIIQ